MADRKALVVDLTTGDLAQVPAADTLVVGVGAKTAGGSSLEDQANKGAASGYAALNAGSEVVQTPTEANVLARLAATAAAKDLGGGSVTNVNLVDGRDVSTDGTKLDGVEALADVTDEANVLVALATSATGKDLGGGAITNVSLVDGRDVSVDGIKLDGVEALADVTDEANVLVALAASVAAKNLGGGAITNVGLVDGRDVSADGAALDTTVAKNASTYVEVSTSQALGVVQPLPLTDATMAGKVAGGATNGAGTVGVVAGSFGTAAAETGTGAGQAGLGAAAATDRPYPVADFPGQRGRALVQFLNANGQTIVLGDMLSTAILADRDAPVYGYASFRSDLAADAKWRVFFYYRRAADGIEVPFTPDIAVTASSVRVAEVFLRDNLPVAAGLGTPSAAAGAAAIGPKSVGTVELDDLAVTDAKIAGGVTTVGGGGSSGKAVRVDAAATTLDYTLLPTVGVNPGAMLSADKTKLDGVEALADVTDDANVRAALAAATADVSFNSKKLSLVADPVGAQDVATKASQDAAVATKQPLDATLTALATLGSAADRLPYFTGVDTVAEAVFTAAGRALIDDADAAAQRATLGAEASANREAVNGYAGLDASQKVIRDPASAQIAAAAGKIPLADPGGTGTIAKEWMPAASETAQGAVELGADNEESASRAARSVGATGAVNGLVRLAADLAGPSSTAAAPTVATKLRKLTFTVAKPADNSAAQTTVEAVFGNIDEAATVTRIVYTPAAGLTANDTDYATIIVRKRDAAGANPTVVDQVTTQITGGTGNWTAWDDVDFGAIASAALVASSKLTFEITKTGAGVVVPAGALTLFYTID